MNIAIGSDHAGFELKQSIIAYLNELGHYVVDKGCYSFERADYSDYGHAVANAILNSDSEKGVLLCGSGNGIAMTANKHIGVRAAICWNKEICSLARQHNDANILVLPARFVSKEEALEMVYVFLNTSFEGGRHEERVKKIDIL